MTNPRDLTVGLPNVALPKERGTLDVKKHFDSVYRRGITKMPRQTTKPKDETLQVHPVAESTKRRFPIDEVRDGLMDEIAELRTRLQRKAPEETNVKIFVLETLQEMLAESDFDPPGRLLRVLQSIKEDYQAYLPKVGS